MMETIKIVTHNLIEIKEYLEYKAQYMVKGQQLIENQELHKQLEYTVIVKFHVLLKTKRDQKHRELMSEVHVPKMQICTK